MKKFCISLLICFIITLTAVAVFLPTGQTTKHTEYLRIHIRANSNLEAEQLVKYKVKDQVIQFLTPYIADCQTKQQAKQLLQNKLVQIQNVATATLKQNGFEYSATARLCEETFPTRVYQDLTLDGGIYDALIIELGSGAGDNWWCVVYPPLCFVGNGENYVYKSKIYQIINDFLKRKGESNEKNN